MITIRDLVSLEDCQRVVALEKEVWGYTDTEDVVPAALLIVSVKRGGILLGAFDDGAMKGFVYSMAAFKDGRRTQWSHMLGVAADARDAGLGARLKLAQRARALAMGVDLIEWTFDPLQAMNAHFNFAKLGVVVEEYEENIYGESSSPLHRGTPTDRLVAEWRLSAPHVERRIAAAGAPLVRDAGIAAAPIVNPPIDASRWPEPATADLNLSSRRILVEIPTDFSGMQASAPDLALAWRLDTRTIFRTYFSRGYRAVDFSLSREHGRGHYLLSRELPVD